MIFLTDGVSDADAENESDVQKTVINIVSTSVIEIVFFVVFINKLHSVDKTTVVFVKYMIYESEGTCK